MYTISFIFQKLPPDPPKQRINFNKGVTGKLSSKEMDKDIQVPDEFVYMTSEPGTKNNELVAMTDNEAANLLLKELNEFALKIDLRPGQTTRPKFHKGKYDDCVDSLALANKASEEIYGDVSLRGIE